MARLILVICFVFCSISCASNGRYPQARRMPYKITLLKHIVQLNIIRENGQAMCTGVVVDESGLIATAKHCVRDNSKVYVLTAAGNEPAGVLGVDKAADLAIIHIEGWNYNPMPLCETPVDIDAGVCAVGRTYDNNLFEFECGDATAVGDELIITTTAVRPGFSGGPLIDIERRCLAGITYAYMPYRMTDPRGYHVGLGALKALLNKYR